MTIAVNPTNGSVVYYDADAATWVPSRVATNGDQSVAFDGKDWVPVQLPKKQGPAPVERADSIGGAFAKNWENPSPFSPTGVIKHLVTAPGRMMQNLQDVQRTAIPAQGGTWTEEDQFKQNLAGGNLFGSAMDVASLGPMSRATLAVKPPNAPVPIPKPSPIAPPAQAADALLQSAESLGVPIPRVLATESVPMQRAGAAVSQAPLVGEPLVNAVRGTTEALGASATNLERGLGAGSQEIAGATAKTDIGKWIRGTSRDAESAAHEAVKDLISPNVTTGLTNAAQTLSSINARRANAGLGESPIGSMLNEAISRPGLNYQGVKDLRSSFGPKVTNTLVQRGMDATEVRAIYSALSKDLESSVRRAGGTKAFDAWKSANSQSVIIKGQQDRLAKIVGVKGDSSPAQVFDRISAMASSRQRADLEGLSLTRKAVGDTAWNEIGSAMIANMGRDAQGAFSAARFLGPNGYNKLSAEAKEILFSPQHRKALDDIATVSAAIKDKVSAFENTSRTGGTVIGAAGLSGMWLDPLTTVASALGGKVLAEYLARPVTAKAVADVVKAQKRVIEVPGPAADRAMQIAVRSLLTIGNALRMPQPQPVR